MARFRVDAKIALTIPVTFEEEFDGMETLDKMQTKAKNKAGDLVQGALKSAEVQFNYANVESTQITVITPPTSSIKENS